MSDATPKVNSRAQTLIGRKINNYNVVSLLGMGGMGAVYVAEHPFIDRKVAIKVLKREHTEDDSLIRRFFNEAKAASAIKHPHIVEIFDMGELDDGIPYIVMELLAGENLGSLIEREKQLEVATAIRITHQTAAALTAAHGKGIVHRDLKPDNLHMVAVESGQQEHVKVLDFGIAKLRPDMAGSNGSTNAGAVMGTPPYMSPEQCLGINADIDSRTDIYALGVILFEMLCGRPPFVGSGMGEIMVAHVTQPPPLPSTFNAKVPPHIEGIILKALAKKREERFATMAEFQAALMAPAPEYVEPPKTMMLPDVPASVSAAAATRVAAPAPRAVRPTTPLRAVTTQAGRDLRAELQNDFDTVPAGASGKKIGLVVGAVVVLGLVAFLLTRGGQPAEPLPEKIAPVQKVVPVPEPLPVPPVVVAPPVQAVEKVADPTPVVTPKPIRHRERAKPPVEVAPAKPLPEAPPPPIPAPQKPKKKVIPSLEF